MPSVRKHNSIPSPAVLMLFRPTVVYVNLGAAEGETEDVAAETQHPAKRIFAYLQLPRAVPRWLIALRPLCILATLSVLVVGELVALHPDWGRMPIAEPPRAEYMPHVIEAGKAYADIVSMLTTLCTGLFVLVALVARRSLLPTTKAAFTDACLIGIFALCATASFYMAIQARFAIAEGILLHHLDSSAIERMIGLEAWLTLFAGLCAGSMIGEALMTFRGPGHEK
jgi:hypothetical protein